MFLCIALIPISLQVIAIIALWKTVAPMYGYMLLEFKNSNRAKLPIEQQS